MHLIKHDVHVSSFNYQTRHRPLNIPRQQQKAPQNRHHRRPARSQQSIRQLVHTSNNRHIYVFLTDLRGFIPVKSDWGWVAVGSRFFMDKHNFRHNPDFCLLVKGKQTMGEICPLHLFGHDCLRVFHISNDPACVVSLHFLRPGNITVWQFPWKLSYLLFGSLSYTNHLLLH